MKSSIRVSYDDIQHLLGGGIIVKHIPKEVHLKQMDMAIFQSRVQLLVDEKIREKEKADEAENLD